MERLNSHLPHCNADYFQTIVKVVVYKDETQDGIQCGSTVSIHDGVEPTQTNRLHRYRPSPNRQYAMGHSSSAPGMQTMYAYGDLQHNQQHHQHQQQQGMQPMSRPSPPQPTWAVPHTHSSYYAAPRGPTVGGREDQQQFMGRPDTMTSQPTATTGGIYSSSMNAPQSLATTNYFPNVIDTSKRLQKQACMQC